MIGFFVIIILLRLFVYDIYRIPSDSMSSTLIPGDYVLMSKLTYGPRIINMRKLVCSGNAEYIRLNGLNKVQKDDVIIFNYPLYEYLIDSLRFIYGSEVIKRCNTMSGDTVTIRKKPIDKIDKNIYFELFPFDSALRWTPEHYGPLYVPKKGDIINITSQNLKRYKDIIFYENQKVKISGDTLLIDGSLREKYCFKFNYYFMLGDNFYQSRDSRFWGFLPETHIIGKAVLVLFSLDPGEPWYGNFQWDRFLKRIR